MARSVVNTWVAGAEKAFLDSLGKLRSMTMTQVLRGFIRKEMSKRRCRGCGCTEDEACAFGCFWVGEDRCSSCPEPTQVVARRRISR